MRTQTLDDGTGVGEGFVHHPHLFLLFESHRPLGASMRWSLFGVDEVLIGRGEARAFQRTHKGKVQSLEIRVEDRWMSTSHVRLGVAKRTWTLEDAGSKNGTRVNGAVEKQRVLADGDIIQAGQTFFLFRERIAIRPRDPIELDSDRAKSAATGLTTLVPELAAGFDDLARMARSDVSIVLGGETGTGKEVVARAVHAASGRKGPFIAVNCGALPPNLVESELFGHRKGAFSGASDDRPGLIRAADGGTLFLDEIGDLPLPAQTAFLRALQEREVTPIGGAHPVKVDVRVVAATHHDLAALAGERRFREDLLARLTGFTLVLPPLRQRREDFGVILAALLRKHGARPGLELEPAAARALLAHDWPMNVRELEKCVASALALITTSTITLRELPPAMRPRDGKKKHATEDSDDAEQRTYLIQLLEEHRGNISAIAAAVGKDRKQVYRWLKKHGLDATAYE